jgi:hypothetical protein
MKKLIVKKQIKLKDGEALMPDDVVLYIPKSEKRNLGVTVFSERMNREVRLSWVGFAMKVLGKKCPSMKTLEKYSNDSICKSIGGKTVEPDGYDQDGYPSWLLVLNII